MAIGKFYKSFQRQTKWKLDFSRYLVLDGITDMKIINGGPGKRGSLVDLF